jgi:hypothetical protein
MSERMISMETRAPRGAWRFASQAAASRRRGAAVSQSAATGEHMPDGRT